MDLRDEFIAKVVEGRSFADVGGLWGVVNEKVTVAARYKARKLTMVDISPAECELWQSFRDRLVASAVEQCECISEDVCALAARAAPAYDVVHCSGVLYHHPNPVQLLGSLRRITVRHLILTSAVLHETVINECGSYHLPSSGAVFVPALDRRERETLWKHWHDDAGVGACYGISEEAAWNPDDLGPWWWLFTPRVMLAMATSVGFRVLDSGPTWNGNAHVALLEAVER
jgi:hypothetical protein